MKQCPACGANNSPDAPSCSICGASLAQVASNETARTLFGMPALKIDQGAQPSEPEPEPEPEPVLAPSGAPDGSGMTRPGFRALGAVELDGSVAGDDSVQMVAEDIRSTQFGAPSPFKAGTIPDPNAHLAEQPEPVAEIVTTQFGAPAPSPVEPAPEPTPEPAASSSIRSTQFGTPSPFKPGQIPDPNAHLAEPAPAAADDILSTQFGAPSPFKAGQLPENEPGPAEPAPRAEKKKSPSTRMGMPSVSKADVAAASARPAASAPAAENYKTLVGPPVPLAEAARNRSRDEAIAEIAEAGNDNYKTLVGPPVPIAEAARAREAGRASSASSGTPAGPSVIVDQGKLSRELAARDRPSVVVDPDLQDDADVIVDDPLPPRGSTAPAAADASAIDERAAAARFAAAIADDERTAMVSTVQPPSNKLWLFVVLILVGLAVAVWFARKAYAVQPRLHDVQAQVTGDQVRVVAAVRADGTVSVGHPEGRMVVDRQGEVAFGLPPARRVPGVHRMALTADVGGSERDLPFEVGIWGRVEVMPVPDADTAPTVRVTAARGWTPEIDSTLGRIEADEPGVWRIVLDPSRARSAVDTVDGLTAPLAVRLELKGPEGASRVVDLSVDVPLAQSPLVLDGPPHRWRSAAARVRVEGRTAPGAEVRVAPGDARTVAGFDGRFGVWVSLEAPGDHRLQVTADAPGRRPTVSSLTVRRLADDAVQTAKDTLASEARARFGAVPTSPDWRRMLEGADALRDRPVELTGRVVTVRQGPDAIDRVVVSTCERESRCPVWVETVDAVMVGANDTVTVVGRLAGTETWWARNGQFVTAPRIEGALLVP